MKRIVTSLLVAAGLAAGTCGVAQAHTDLSIGLSLGAPAPVYTPAAPVYVAPQPVYYGHPDLDRRDEGDGYRRRYRDWDHGYSRWSHGDWDRGERGSGWRG